MQFPRYLALLAALCCGLSLADVAVHPRAENEAPLRFENARCEWDENDVVIRLGDPESAPFIRIRLADFPDYEAKLKKDGGMRLKLHNEGFGDVAYTDIHGMTRHVPNHVKDATCTFTLSEVKYDGNFLEAFRMTAECDGFRAKDVPFQRGFSIRAQDPIDCTFR